MAGRPTSGITASTDVNLDFLTKEEKEALLSKKMDMIRLRNKMINERHETIEADRRKAEESGNAVKALDSKTLPAEGALAKPKGRGRGQSQGSSNRDGTRPNKERPKSHGYQDTSSYEPIVDVSDFTVHRTMTADNNRSNNNNNNNRGNHSNKVGQNQQNQYRHQERDRDAPPANTPKNRRKPHHQKEEAEFRQQQQEPHFTVALPALAFDYEPIVDLNDLDHRFGARSSSSTQAVSKQTDNGNTSAYNNNNNNSNNNTRGYNSGQARSNRRSDPPDNDHSSKSKSYDGRLKKSNPPPDPTFNPLSDWRRGGGGGGGPDKKEGLDRQERSDRSDRPDHNKRHPRNYGGGADLNKVKDNMKTMREKEKERPTGARPLEMVMTGRERKNHEVWKQERERCDNERLQRQLGEAGNWKREWDQNKVVLDYDDLPHSKMEPAKRPAGRIGSGRFDRGDSREDRPSPKAVGKDGKGGSSSQQQNYHQQQQRHHPQQQPQHQQPPPTSSHHHHQQQQHAPLSPQSSSSSSSAQLHQQHQQQHVDSKAPPRSTKGRGRGRGRGRGASPGIQGQGQGSVGGPGVVERSPRPRTWSGGDDRFVECQKEMLVVKFDNTVGDNSVEVEYENGAPMSPTPSSKSSGSNPGRGPTGRTPNQSGSGNGGSSSVGRAKGGSSSRQQPPPSHNQHKPSKGKSGGTGRLAAIQQQFTQVDQFMDAEWDSAADLNYRHSYDGSLTTKARTLSSHSHSQGDSEEWEDCTQSSGAPEEEDGLIDDDHPIQNLHLECQLNPEAPEFLPTSPDFLKTPPGHVKVMNWAGPGSNSPTASSKSNLSQPDFSSVSSPRQIPEKQTTGSDQQEQSPFSSPGSSASTRAKNRREEMDEMPEPDEPLPPPFLLPPGTSSGAVIGLEADDERITDVVVENGDKSLEKEDDEDSEDEDEEFEDTVDNVPEDSKKEMTPVASKADEFKEKEEPNQNITEKEPLSQDEEMSVSREDKTEDITSPQPASNNDSSTNEDIAVSATREDIAVSATNEDIAVSTTREDIAVSATNEDIAVSTTREDIAVSATNEDIAVSTTREDIAVSATNEDIAVSTTREDIAVSATNEDIAVSTTREDIAVSATNEDIAVSTTREDIAVSATNEDIAVSTTREDIAVSATNEDIAVSTTREDIAVSATNEDIAVPTTTTTTATAESGDKPDDVKEAEASKLHCGEEISETKTDVSELPESSVSVANDGDGHNDEKELSLDPAIIDDDESHQKTEESEDEKDTGLPNHPEIKTDADPEMSDSSKSDKDQTVISTDANANIESNTDCILQPTAEHSAAS